jgi:hypothetical protein
VELGEQGSAVAGRDAGRLGQAGAGDLLAGGHHGGVGGADAFPLAARIAGWVELVDPGQAVVDVQPGGELGAVEQAQHRERAEQPDRGRPGGEVADQRAGGDGDLEQGDRG